jgi:hypothetical protein
LRRLPLAPRFEAEFMSSARASSTGDPALDRDGEKLDHAPTSGAASLPTARQIIFSSVLTPNWLLGLLLFACMFMPFYEGCNNKTVYIYESLGDVEPTASSVYSTFLRGWPFLFGLVLSAGTLATALACNPLQNRTLWRGLALLILANGFLLIPNIAEACNDGSAAIVVLPSVLLLLLLFGTAKYGRNWFQLGVVLQLVLACLATPWLPIIAVFNTRLLIGGKLAVGAGSLLIVSSIVEFVNARRALTRQPGESPLQLSLRSMLLIMLVGGIVFSLVGAWIVAESG